MDVTQKRKMHRVAVIHFVLTCLVVLVLLVFFPGAYHFSGDSIAQLRFEQYIIWHEAWKHFWEIVFYILQPQFRLLISGGKSSLFFAVASMISVPVWSFCFGWIFIKLDNWLNHFPVLGKKVF
jgi:hypothetical protein